MPRPRALGAELERRLVAVHDLAAGMVATWADDAAATATAGQERALLRLIGVGGLDAAGRPLAAEVVDHYLAGPPGRLGLSVLLPFAVALREYDTAPQALALDIASGAIDLGLEAALLEDPGRRAEAEAEARRLVSTGLERIDANRLARRELIEMLGEPARPWVGTTLTEPVAADAMAQARSLIREGADVVRVEVPSGRELALRLGARGVEVRRWQPGAESGSTDGDRIDAAPAGSQRGLASLREAIDAAAAERGAYVRLVSAAPALSAPEAAVVAAFERIDLVEADPVEEIVSTGVDAGRAFADHAFARRLDRRAGTAIVLGAGPLVVAPDLARGVPSDPAVRAGRGLGLQVLSAGFAAAGGLPPEQVMLGAMPGWLLGEHASFARAVAEIWLRRRLLPKNPLVFSEPPDGPRSASWPYLLASILPPAPAAALVIRRPAPEAFGRMARATRAAAAVAAEVGASVDGASLEGRGLEHARASLGAAVALLEEVASLGWGTLGEESHLEARAEGGWIGLGRESIGRRSDPFDALGPEEQPGG